MQIVTFEVCASLIFPAASAPPASPTMLVASNTHIDARGAIIHSLPLTVAAPQPNLNREANLDNTSECVDFRSNKLNRQRDHDMPVMTGHEGATALSAVTMDRRQACRFAAAPFFNDNSA